LAAVKNIGQCMFCVIQQASVGDEG